MNAESTLQVRVQWNALRNGCGLVKLSDWSSVTLTGADRQQFLNNFCTNDAKRLTPGENCEAFFCNVKGRIIGHGVITCRDNELVIVGAPGQGGALASHLDRYVIREDVAVRDSTAERAYLLLAGDSAPISAAFALTPAVDIGAVLDRPWLNAGGRISDVPVRWIHWSLLSPIFSGLIELRPADVSRVQAALSERNVAHCSSAAFDTVRIEAGTPLFGIDFDDRNFPQEIGRNEQAISFTKGCYLGQETVARIDALGHVNQQIVGVAFPTDVPAVGAELTQAGGKVGRVTSAAFSPSLGRLLALAMVRREHSGVGSKLESPSGPCEVIALPITNRPAAS